MPKKEEIIESFEINHGFNLVSLLNDFKDDSNHYAFPILDNHNIDTQQFVDLVKFNIDYKSFYENMFKK